MSLYAVYTLPGAITKVLMIQPDSLAGNLAVGESAIEIQGQIDTEYFYVDLSGLPTLTARPLLGTSVGPLAFSTAEHLTITCIPAGTIFRHPDGEIVVDDGFIEWGAEEPGKYRLQLELFPYLTETFYAQVTEA